MIPFYNSLLYYKLVINLRFNDSLLTATPFKSMELLYHIIGLVQTLKFIKQSNYKR